MNAEGWYQDPYGAHDDRWYSDGTPTALVRDAGTESQDPPPSGAVPQGPLVRSVAPGDSAGPTDLRRADDADTGQTPDYAQKAMDEMSQFPLPPY
jgi:hypothetical protein